MDKKDFIVYGYLASWKTPEWLLDKINWKALTHIVDSFLIPLQDGDIELSTTKKLLLSEAAHRNNVFCNVSIGGAKHSENFSKIANDFNLRKKFIKNIIEILKTYNYDGIDIDWEFPNKNDRENFTNLMKELYFEIKNSKLKTFKNTEPFLTFFTTTGLYDDGVKWDEIGNYCDYAIQSGYDWNNPYNAPLRNTGKIKTNAGEIIENSIDGFAKSIISRGFSKEKFLLGLPFYSKPSGINYGKIKQGKFLRYDELQAEAAYQFNGKVEYFNDANAFKEKIKYVKEQKRPGIAIWDVSMIYPETDLWDVISCNK